MINKEHKYYDKNNNTILRNKKLQYNRTNQKDQE